MPAQNRSPVTEEEAISLQLSLRRRCENRNPLDAGSIQIVAGADAAYTKTRIFGAMVCVSYPEIEIIAESVAEAPVSFPYIPGLFAFRELPVLEACWPGLGKKPDLVIVEGHGYAHPRRFGLASHLGVVLDVPTIGVAKKILVGSVQDPGQERGSVCRIMEDDEVIGTAVRTREGSKPVYVSRGCGTDLAQAQEIVLGLTPDHRMPAPLVCADRLCRRQRADWLARQQPG